MISFSVPFLSVSASSKRAASRFLIVLLIGYSAAMGAMVDEVSRPLVGHWKRNGYIPEIESELELSSYHFSPDGRFEFARNAAEACGDSLCWWIHGLQVWGTWNVDGDSLVLEADSAARDAHVVEFGERRLYFEMHGGDSLRIVEPSGFVSWYARDTVPKIPQAANVDLSSSFPFDTTVLVAQRLDSRNYVRIEVPIERYGIALVYEATGTLVCPRFQVAGTFGRYETIDTPAVYGQIEEIHKTHALFMGEFCCSEVSCEVGLPPAFYPEKVLYAIPVSQDTLYFRIAAIDTVSQDSGYAAVSIRFDLSAGTEIHPHAHARPASPSMFRGRYFTIRGRLLPAQDKERLRRVVVTCESKATLQMNRMP